MVGASERCGEDALEPALGGDNGVLELPELNGRRLGDVCCEADPRTERVALIGET